MYRTAQRLLSSDIHMRFLSCADKSYCFADVAVVVLGCFFFFFSPLFDATWRRKNTFRRYIGIFSLSRQYHCNKCLWDDSINRTAKILLENVSLDGRVVSTKFFLHVCTCKPTSVRLHASKKDNILMKEVWPVISSAWSDNGNRLSRTFVYATRVVSANQQRPPNHRNRN